MVNKPYIDNIVKQASNAEELRSFFSDHFDSLTEPVSVSLGWEKQNVDDVVSMLRSKGIDAVPYYDKEVKDNLGCFVVDGTGVRSPFLKPEDAIKATADMFEIMQQNNISTSRALPVSKENLIPAVHRTYDSKIIDVAQNGANERFLSDQLKLVKEMSPIDTSVSKENQLYRGATLGDKPYALTFHRRYRDAAYATKDFADAGTYANGEKGAGLKYKEIDGQSYGFIYQFEESSKGQQYYSMAGIEKPKGSEECIGHKDNKEDYETLILNERNPLKGIYLKVDDKVVQIANEKGYISKDWEKFAQLHTPYNVSEKNDYMVERMNKQISNFSVASYERRDLSNKSFNPEFEGLTFGNSIKKISEADNKYKYEINNADFSSVKLPKDISSARFTGDFNLDNCYMPEEMDTLDLSKCTGIVGFSNCDLSNFEKIVLPENCKVFFLSNVKLPKEGALDFSNMKCPILSLENVNDLSNREIKHHKDTYVKPKGDTKLPDNMNNGSIDVKFEISRVREKVAARNNMSKMPQHSDNIKEPRCLESISQTKTSYKPKHLSNVDLTTLKYAKDLHAEGK